MVAVLGVLLLFIVRGPGHHQKRHRCQLGVVNVRPFLAAGPAGRRRCNEMLLEVDPKTHHFTKRVGMQGDTFVKGGVVVQCGSVHLGLDVVCIVVDTDTGEHGHTVHQTRVGGHHSETRARAVEQARRMDGVFGLGRIQVHSIQRIVRCTKQSLGRDRLGIHEIHNVLGDFLGISETLPQRVVGTTAEFGRQQHCTKTVDTPDPQPVRGHSIVGGCGGLAVGRAVCAEPGVVGRVQGVGGGVHTKSEIEQRWGSIVRERDLVDHCIEGLYHVSVDEWKDGVDIMGERGGDEVEGGGCGRGICGSGGA